MSPQGRGSFGQVFPSLAAFLTRQAGWILFICLLLMMLWVFLMPAVTPRVLRGLMDTPEKLDADWSHKDKEALSEALSGYLSSSRDSAQAQVHVNGQLVPAFESHELKHLADVRGLFALAFRLAVAALIILAAVSIIILTARTDRLAARFMTLAGGYQAASLGVLGVLAVLALLAGLRFEQAFYAMHKLLFTNNLWLLDPQKDVLIQLMPQRFFVDYAQTAARPVLFILSFLLLASTAVRAGAAYVIKQRIINP